MSNVLEYHNFCVKHEIKSLLGEYLAYCKTTDLPTKGKLAEFLYQLTDERDIRQDIFATYYGLVVPVLPLPLDIGVDLFVRAITVHNETCLIREIIKHICSNHVGIYNKLKEVSSNEKVWLMFMDFVAKHSAYFSEIFKSFREDFPGICTTWLNGINVPYLREYQEFCVKYVVKSLLGEYLIHSGIAKPQTNDKIQEFLNNLNMGIYKNIFIRHFNIDHVVSPGMFPMDIGIELFIRAVLVHTNTDLAEKIITKTTGSYADNYSRIKNFILDEEVLKTFMTCVMKNCIGFSHNFVIINFHKDFPEMFTRWINENIDERRDYIIKFMSRDSLCAKVLKELIRH